jgi:hypothetical protein
LDHSTAEQLNCDDNKQDIEPVEDTWFQYHSIRLTQRDKQEIMCGGWLNNSIINTFQNMLKEQFPGVSGLQNTVFTPLMQFEPKVNGFLQVFHVHGNHWGTASTFKKSDNNVGWYDSMHLAPSRDVITAIADLMQHTGDRIIINIKNVQRQVGSSD